MKHGLISIVFLLLGACTEVQVVAPNPRVEPPELRGNNGVKISVDGVGAHIFKATSDGSTRPPDMNSPSVHASADVAPGFSFSPDPEVELGVELLPLGGGADLVAKWQALGEGSREAQVGNVPLGFYIRAGNGYGQQSGNQSGLFGPGGYPWKGTVNATFVHAGTSIGYRFSNHALFYGGAAVGQYWIHAEVNQDAANGDRGGSYKNAYTGTANSEALGFLFNWRVVQFFVSAEYNHLHYQQAGGLDNLYLHGGIYITPK